MSSLVVTGDAILDRDVLGRVGRVAPDAPVPVLEEQEERLRPGGAALAAVMAAADGADVTLLTALPPDGAADALCALLIEHGVAVADRGCSGRTTEKTRLRCGAQTLLRLDRDGRVERIGPLTPDQHELLAGADAILVSDYGRGVADDAPLRAALTQAAATVPLVWDPHPRGGAPVAGTWCATPNDREAAAATGLDAGAELLAPALLERWPVGAALVTRGARGAVLCSDGASALELPVTPAAGDPCGAGDRLASRLAVLLGAGMPLQLAAQGAVQAAGAFVGGGGVAAEAWGALPPPGLSVLPGGADHSLDAACRRAEQVRRDGGVVVATGGCFDIVHAGHVALLQSAAALGDALVVLVNDDASVRRLKGPSRPFNTLEDRVRVLTALDGVDAVVPFAGDEPTATLQRLRPDVWVKGGDYHRAELPEAAALERWGGRVVLVPALEGRSTTRLAEEISCRMP